MHSAERTYLPAAGKDWLLPLYDPLTRLLGVGNAHRKLIHQAGIEPGQAVLEIGCGTGNLTILMARLCAGTRIVGMDPDPKALERARRKAESSGASIRFDQGFAEALAYPDGSFDRVLSALMLHHLPADTKAAALREALRVLRPGGSLHVVDFAGHQQSTTGVHGALARVFESHDLEDHVPDVLDLMRHAGFIDCEERARERTVAGQIVYYSARRER
jgi:ubiquinone/menaquinone biosynthesis C-methylase UbiE